MIVGPRNKLHNLEKETPVTISDIPVKFVKQYNYLGVIIDAEMQYNQC